MSTVAPLLEAFFTDRLMAQRNASAHTVAAYRDAFRLLLGFVYQQTGIPPAAMDLADLDSGMIAAFLDHLERDRANSPATRNARLAALRSFFRYAAFHAPEHAGLIQRVLAIPDRRSQTQDVCFLTEDRADTLVNAPDRRTWISRRDHALLVLDLQTGLRVSGTHRTGRRRRPPGPRTLRPLPRQRTARTGPHRCGPKPSTSCEYGWPRQRGPQRTLSFPPKPGGG